MEFNSVVTVLSASRYSFKDEKDGHAVQGCKVRYVESWDSETEQNAKGVRLLSASLPLGDYDSIINLPADYNATFSIRADGKGRPVLHLKSLEYVQPFKPFQSALVSPNSEKAGK